MGVSIMFFRFPFNNWNLITQYILHPLNFIKRHLFLHDCLSHKKTGTHQEVW